MMETSSPTSPDTSREPGLLLALAVLVVLLLCVRPSESGPATTAILPSDLAGTWFAEGELYRNRFFELTPNQLVLGLGTGPSRTHPLTAVVVGDSSTTRVFDLRYAAPDGIQSMEVHLKPDGTLRLRNPEHVVWRRRSTRSFTDSR
jgi:hypothetical protein